jgi:Ino eighty subunit 1
MHQYFPKVTELHFQNDQDFFDLIMGTNMSSETRARAFLWLMWWYLESDFSYEDSQRNPFGPGQVSEADRHTDPLHVKVPTIAILTEEQEEAENVDPPSELKFGEDKRKERIGILASEPSPAMIALKRARKEKGHSSTPGISHGDDAGSDAGWAEYPSGKLHRKCLA